MVVWRARALALDLRDGRVAERDKLGYLLVGLLIQAVIGHASLLSALRSLGVALGILGDRMVLSRTSAAYRGGRRCNRRAAVCLTNC